MVGVFRVFKERPRKTMRIHRLVALLFIDNPLNLPQVNHLDSDKQNNHVSNLEWCTESRNVMHSIGRNPTQLDGMINYNQVIRPRQIVQKTRLGVFINKFRNAKDASIETGVCHRNILQVINKTEFKPGHTRKQAGGFVWEIA